MCELTPSEGYRCRWGDYIMILQPADATQIRQIGGYRPTLATDEAFDIGLDDSVFNMLTAQHEN